MRRVVRAWPPAPGRVWLASLPVRLSDGSGSGSRRPASYLVVLLQRAPSVFVPVPFPVEPNPQSAFRPAIPDQGQSARQGLLRLLRRAEAQLARGGDVNDLARARVA